MPPKKSQSSPVWEHFVKIEVDGEIKTECKLCKARLAYKSTTSTMAPHLKLKHPTSNVKETTDSNRKRQMTLMEVGRSKALMTAEK